MIEENDAYRYKVTMNYRAADIDDGRIAFLPLPKGVPEFEIECRAIMKEVQEIAGRLSEGERDDVATGSCAGSVTKSSECLCASAHRDRLKASGLIEYRCETGAYRLSKLGLQVRAHLQATQTETK